MALAPSFQLFNDTLESRILQILRKTKRANTELLNTLYILLLLFIVVQYDAIRKCGDQSNSLDNPLQLIRPLSHSL